MSVPGSIVQNASTKLYVDLTGSSFTPGTNIIIYSLNQTGGTRNQNWRFISVDSDKNLYKVQSVLTGLYAAVDSASSGQAIKTSATDTAWQVTAVDTYSDNFIIRLPNTDLVWNVPAGSSARTNITIVAATANNTAQQWKITNV